MTVGADARPFGFSPTPESFTSPGATPTAPTLKPAANLEAVLMAPPSNPQRSASSCSGCHQARQVKPYARTPTLQTQADHFFPTMTQPLRHHRHRLSHSEDH